MKNPNPCVACNKYIKLGATIDKAEELGMNILQQDTMQELKVSDGNKVNIYLRKERMNGKISLTCSTTLPKNYLLRQYSL